MDPLTGELLKVMALPLGGFVGAVLGWWTARRSVRATVRRTDTESEKLGVEMLRLQQQSNTELLDRLATMQKRLLELLPLEERIFGLERQLGAAQQALTDVQERLAECEKFRADWILDRR